MTVHLPFVLHEILGFVQSARCHASVHKTVAGEIIGDMLHPQNQIMVGKVVAGDAESRLEDGALIHLLAQVHALVSLEPIVEVAVQT